VAGGRDVRCHGKNTSGTCDGEGHLPSCTAASLPSLLDNMTIVRTVGLTIPPSLLLRADQIIEVMSARRTPTQDEDGGAVAAQSIYTSACRVRARASCQAVKYL
jgi:hypothetical protein